MPRYTFPISGSKFVFASWLFFADKMAQTDSTNIPFLTTLWLTTILLIAEKLTADYSSRSFSPLSHQCRFRFLSFNRFWWQTLWFPVSSIYAARHFIWLMDRSFNPECDNCNNNHISFLKIMDGNHLKLHIVDMNEILLISQFFLLIL